MQDVLVRGSAWLSFACYLATYVMWYRRQPWPWVRWSWTVAWVIFAVHVVLAFHLVHHWSHDAAYAATEKQGGLGAGLYVNYAVVLLWLIEVARCWQPVRSLPWYSRLNQGVLLFVWFNATTIFALGYAWIVGALGFIVLGWCVLRRRSG
jgi:hypothetical protein